jgi:hypothetical protein
MGDMRAMDSDTDRVGIFVNGRRIGAGEADRVDKTEGVFHLSVSAAVALNLPEGTEIILVTDEKQQFKAKVAGLNIDGPNGLVSAKLHL